MSEQYVAEKKIKWNGSIGPAFLAVILQTLVLAGGFIITYTRLSDSVDATKSQLIELKNVTAALKDTQATAQERVVKLETSLGFLSTSLDRLNVKLDTIPTVKN